jgi:hypothetical protein
MGFHLKKDAEDDSSIEILWRGSDPAKFTALQAALGDEGIQFWHAQTYDSVGGFLSSRPYYLEAMPGFEIRVHARDLQRAQNTLALLESSVEISGGAAEPDADPPSSKQLPPRHWDIKEATAEIWAGEDEAMAEYLASALRENGIPSHVPNEPGHRVRLLVRPSDGARARKIIGEVGGSGATT